MTNDLSQLRVISITSDVNYEWCQLRVIYGLRDWLVIDNCERSIVTNWELIHRVIYGLRDSSVAARVELVLCLYTGRGREVTSTYKGNVISPKDFWWVARDCHVEVSICRFPSHQKTMEVTLTYKGNDISPKDLAKRLWKALETSTWQVARDCHVEVSRGLKSFP